jgi:hypothetical protein
MRLEGPAEVRRELNESAWAALREYFEYAILLTVNAAHERGERVTCDDIDRSVALALDVLEEHYDPS